MRLIENIRESTQSIRANKLRSILTILTIAVGIACLVGILTAVEAMRQNYLNQYARLGVNSFTIHSVRNWRNRRKGILRKDVRPIKYAESIRFINAFDPTLGQPSLRVGLTRTAQLLRGDQKTYPNVSISGVDEHYLFAEFLDLEKGRNFLPSEVERGSPVAIIGDEVYQKLFPSQSDPIGSYLVARGTRYKIIGKLKEVGASSRGMDNSFLIPLQRSLQSLGGGRLNIRIIVQVHDLEDIESATGLATSLMRNIRGDKPTDEHSFELRRSTSMEERINEEMGNLKTIGYVIGSITLIAACIGLMNIMLIHVKERTREIGLRKAIGATSYEIRMQFLTEAISICQIGGLVGIFFGLLIGNGTASILNASFVFPFFVLLVAVLLSTLVGVLAGYIPAKQAADVDPIKSMRYE